MIDEIYLKCRIFSKYGESRYNFSSHLNVVYNSIT